MRTIPIRRAAQVALVALTVLAATPRIAAAVNVSPAVLVIDARTREGVVTLSNSGTHPEEVELGFQFGISASDSLGNLRLLLSDSAGPGQPSAVSWLRVFPRRLILGPGESQTVRIIARPPTTLEAGEYWARLVVSAVPQGPAIEERQGEATMQLRVGTRIVAAVHYRAGGRMHVGVTAAAVGAQADGDYINLVLDLARQGNAAFVGRIRMRILAADGTAVGVEHVETLTLYNDGRRRFRIPATGPRGRPVAVEYTIDTSRDDFPAGVLVRAQPVSGRVAIGRATAAEAGTQR